MPTVPPELRWLTSGAAAPWLADPELAVLQPMALANRLRRKLSAEQSRRLSEQFELRRRAKLKFARAEQMFFTSLGLEQATDEGVARYKATRFPTGAAVADLCTGVGGDLVSLAMRGRVIGLDRSPEVAWLAAANLERLVGGGLVAVGDVTRLCLGGVSAWHIDPDRRPEGRKTSRVESSQPSREALDALREANPHAAIKLSPAAEAPDDWRDAAEFEWISRGRECRQQVAWFGSLATEPGRLRATLLDAQGELLRTFCGDEQPLPIAADSVRQYVYEPDAAVLAARLTGALAASHGLLRLSTDVAYLTGDAQINDPALAAFEVLEALPFDRRRVRAICRERGVGRIEVKKRGVDFDPAKLQAELAGAGELEAVLIVYRQGAGARAVLARRV